MAAELGRPLVTVACNDDTSATDLIGRYLARGDTVWQAGPLTRAVRDGGCSISMRSPRRART